MTARTWLILGATSIIAEKFAHLAAQSGQSLILAGRDRAQLEIIVADIRLRYEVACDFLFTDFAGDLSHLLQYITQSDHELDLFIAYSYILQNHELNEENIKELVLVNISSTLQLINAYWQKPQSQHHLIFLSSVAACRGRAKNSLYGASKAATEIYLEGLQQAATKTKHITIAKLGFIDTTQTYGVADIFYASPPEACAKACWRASLAGKRLIYHPFFWRFIMAIIRRLPFFIYKRMKL